MEALAEALKDEDARVRKEAASVLDKLGWKPGTAIDEVHYLLAGQEWNELVELGEPAVAFLIESLKDKNRSVREGSAFALGGIGDERAVDALTELLKDEDESMRDAAKNSLRRMRNART